MKNGEFPVDPQPAAADVLMLHWHYTKHSQCGQYENRVSWIGDSSGVEVTRSPHLYNIILQWAATLSVEITLLLPWLLSPFFWHFASRHWDVLHFLFFPVKYQRHPNWSVVRQQQWLVDCSATASADDSEFSIVHIVGELLMAFLCLATGLQGVISCY